MLRSYAQMLNGRMMKRVFVHTSPFGDNGKSRTFEFLKVISGRYGKTMPIKYLTSIEARCRQGGLRSDGREGSTFRSNGGARQQRVHKGALACELTGGSKISGREVFCAWTTDPSSFPHLACNKLQA